MKLNRINGLFKLCWLLLWPLWSAGPAWAQASENAPVLEPATSRPPAEIRRAEYRVETLKLDVSIEDQKAVCRLTQVIHNPTARPIEVEYLRPLPLEGAVAGLTLLADGQELAGKIYNKDEAWNVYREIVAGAQDPALLEYAGQGLFKARIFPVPARGRRSLELKFEMLLKKEDGQTSFVFPLADPLTQGREIEDQAINIRLKTSQPLKTVYSPVEMAISRQSDREAVVSLNARQAPPLETARLYFQAREAASIGGMVLSHKPDQDDDGYFIFLADPGFSQDSDLKEAKNVIFVLDVSGSMSGRKLKQAQEALIFILERLNDQDNFNLITYNEEAALWRPEWAAMNAGNRAEAKNFAAGLRAGGNTNLEAALRASWAMITDHPAPTYILFLTDGQPTAGETREKPLADLAQKLNSSSNARSARLFAFGVGNDVNARLLDRLSGQNGGASVYVLPDENLERALAGFFAKIDAPALTGPEIRAGLKINRVLPETLPDLFRGRQLVAVGRYSGAGATNFTLAGRVGAETKTFVYPAQLASGSAPGGEFIERLWAQRRIGEIIDQLDLAALESPNQNLVNELVALSKRYGILTPYTSFLALEDEDILNTPNLQHRAAANIKALETQVVGAEANKQRRYKGRAKTMDQLAAPRSAEAEQFEMNDLASMDLAVAGKAGPSRLTVPNQWGGRAFFYKNNQWEDSLITEKDLERLKVVVQLSEEYFKLAEELEPGQMAWLTQARPVVFLNKGQAYRIEPLGR